tara:strand:- start:98718 stop:98912 length:195 start_codon:yes stop_codon:yes gene_type:complete
MPKFEVKYIVKEEIRITVEKDGILTHEDAQAEIESMTLDEVKDLYPTEYDSCESYVDDVVEIEE